MSRCLSSALSALAWFAAAGTAWGQAAHPHPAAEPGHPTPPGEWYDQPNAEWVLLARGTAVLEFEAGERVALAAGDHLQIPPHARHRVEAVSVDAVWVALHY